jgi:hypothetical protein
MLTSHFSKTLRLASFALILLGSLTSCQSLQGMDPEEDRPTMALELPTPGTPCSGLNNTFATSHTVSAARGGSSYQFSVKVLRAAQCDLSNLSGGNCSHLGDAYVLNVNPAFNLNYSQFGNIQTTNLSGATINHYINMEGTSLRCNEPFIAKFTWNAMNSNNPTPSADRFNSGGVCIIGIIQDPNGDPDNNG